MEDFLKTIPKQISEIEFISLRNKWIKETYGDYVPTSLSNAYAWFTPKKQEFQKILEAAGVKILWKTDLQEQFDKWIKTQGDPPRSVFARLDWFSQKKKEFEEKLTLFQMLPGERGERDD